MAYVYKITSPTGKIYVGSTINNINERMGCYKRLDCKFQRKIYNSLLKYGWNAHTFEVICECEKLEARGLEIKYGKQFDVLGKNGLNCRLPKDGETPSEFCDETRKIMSERQKGRKASLETRQKQSDSLKGKPSSMKDKKHKPETIIKMKIIQGENKYNKGGYKLSKEFCEAVSERLIGNTYSLGFKHTPETCIKRSIISKNGNHEGLEFRDKKTIDLETGIVFDSLKDAYHALPKLNQRWKYKYMTNMLSGYKRNQTSLMYA